MLTLLLHLYGMTKETLFQMNENCSCRHKYIKNKGPSSTGSAESNHLDFELNNNKM